MSAAMESTLTTTRRSLHALAEGLLAGPQYRATGTIRLAVRAGGFATSRAYGNLSLLAVEATDLLVVRGDHQLRLPLTGTCGDLAAAAGLLVDSLEDVYSDSVRPEPSTPLDVEPDAAATLAAAWHLGERALRAFAAEVPGPDPRPVLWPEHFDVALTVEGSDYGVSPGDDAIPEPYAYISSSAAHQDGAFWNQPFGAARPLTDLPDPNAVTDFYRTGHALTRQPR
jgi:hypothetical protein